MWLLLVIAAGLAPAEDPSDRASPRGRLPTVAVAAAVERLPLAGLHPEAALTLDPLARTVVLHSPRDRAALARLAPVPGGLCPRKVLQRDSVVLLCNTNRLDAVVVRDRGRVFLELRELRGLPLRSEDQRLEAHYDPARFQLGDACPGTTPASRAECALRGGAIEEARVQLRLAFDTAARPYAALRLGDLAREQGDVGEAARWYGLAGVSGPFGRLARIRLCELGAVCPEVTKEQLFDSEFLPEPARSEVELRAVRMSVFDGRNREAAERLARLFARPEGAAFCGGSNQRLCRRLLLHLLDERGSDVGALAVETFLTMPDRGEGPYALELARAAAERAAAIGAPVFAAHLLASSASLVEEAALPELLLRTAELYLIGNDRPRARVVLEYAEERIGRARLGNRWDHVRSELRGMDDEAGGGALEREILMAETTRDLAGAFRALVRSRLVAPRRRRRWHGPRKRRRS